MLNTKRNINNDENKTKKQHVECCINQVDIDGSTPLHKAADDKTQHHLLEELLKTDKRINCKDNNGDYPLHLALLKGCSLEVFKVLMAAGADISVKTKHECNALHCAVEGPTKDEKDFAYDIAVIEELCQYPELWDEEHEEGLTPFEYALIVGCPTNVFDALWKHYSDSNKNILTIAVIGKCDGYILEKIIEKDKSLVNLPNTNDQLPIHIVSRCAKACKILIEAGSDLWYKDDKGNIPLRNCVKNRDASFEVVREFLKHMDRDKLIEDEKVVGYSILYDACRDVWSFFHTERVEALLDAGFNPMIKYDGNQSPIDVLCEHTKLAAVLLVLKKWPTIFLDCKDLRNKYLSATERHFKHPKHKKLAMEFAQCVVKWITLLDRNAARQTFQSDDGFKPHQDLLNYFEGCLDELEVISNFKLTSSKSLHDVILGNFKDPILRTDTKKRRRTYWMLLDKAIEFDVSNITIYKKQVTDVQNRVLTCQLYNERLCTKTEDGKVVFLTRLASERVFDYLNCWDLQQFAKAVKNLCTLKPENNTSSWIAACERLECTCD